LQSRAIGEKTWAQFKLDFATSHHEFRLTSQTAHQSGFHSVNMMIEKGRDESIQDTADAIAQLKKATASYRGAVATLTTTNAKLAAQLEAATHRSRNSRTRSRHRTSRSNLHGRDNYPSKK
jgi:small-conductance mechanosensitive channel